MRIGGNSADESLWWPTEMPLPPNQTYAITKADLLSYAAALPLWNGFAVLDTSMFLENSTLWGVSHVRAVTDTIGWGRVEGVEIGNEPECYHDSGIRPNSWDFGDYEEEWAAHVEAFQTQGGLPPGMIQGAVFCCHNPYYDGGFYNYTAANSAKGYLKSVSYHHYALGGCEGKTAYMWQLMEDPASQALVLQPFVAAARAASIPFHVGEGNSVSCGGEPGVSDAFGAALWALDMLLNAAQMGVEQFNFHGGPTPHYTAIAYPHLPSSAVPSVRPLYYGIFAMSFLAANGTASVVSADVQTTNPLIKAWCLRSTPGGGGGTAQEWSVVIIHKDYNATEEALVSISPPSPTIGGPATLWRLSAPNISAPFGISFAGLTWDGTVDGKPSGTPDPQQIDSAGGVWSFSVPPASAAILTFSASQGDSVAQADRLAAILYSLKL
jgi:hypothetical protein